MWAVLALLRGLANVAMFFAFVGGLIWVVFFWYMDNLRQTDDPIYARDLFTGYLAYEKVLATRRWHARDSEPWDCTYAIVELPKDASEEAPSWRDRPEGWQFRYGGAWIKSPLPPLGNTTRNAIGFCARYFSPELNERMRRAVTKPGSWVIRESVGSIIYIYSLPERLAARIRFDD